MAKESEDKLTCVLRTRVSKPTHDRLEKLRAKSNVRTMGEFLRAIINKEKINWYHKSAELESLALEFALIRKELNSIGRNINQITKLFHGAGQMGQRMIHALKAESEYKKVEGKVKELLSKMDDVAGQWLRK